MILEIDMGNTRLKWRLRKGVRVVEQGDSIHHKTGDFSAAFSAVNGPLSAIWVSSVVPDLNQRLVSWCHSVFGVMPILASVGKSSGGVINGYRDVSQMGVDRWLGMIAAFHQSNSACLVVDSGSALTIDLILSSGQHLGGYISPGLGLMQKALSRDTGRLKPLEIRYDGPLKAGKSTQEAVAASMRLMHLGVVMSALHQLLDQEGSNVDIFLTGGGGEALCGQMQALLVEKGLRSSINCLRVEPALVLDGLHFIIEDYQEKNEE